MVEAREVAGQALADGVRRGDARAIGRALSLVEDESIDAATLLARLHSATGRASLVGVTGPPGAGKSTLVDGLVAAFRRSGARVAVLAVDPSSPYSGGAMLGDRIRLQAHATDEAVFIRSMATHGRLGGLAPATADAAAVLDAAGYDPIIVETAGVGQSEVDIVRLADVSVVVMVPGAGDDVQALKAGVMEIADLFVVNKADRAGADQTVAAIEATLDLDERPNRPERPPILRTVATTGAGVEDVVLAIDRLRARARATGAARRRAREEARLRARVAARLAERVAPARFAAVLDRLSRRELTEADAVAALVAPAPAEIDHVGIAVSELAAGATFLVDVLGLVADAPEDVADQHVRVQFVGRGETRLEFLAPTDASSPLAGFLQRRGPGLHHVAIQVANIDQTLTDLKARAVRLVDEQPRLGAHGRRIAFVHPSAAHGVLVELVERPGESDAAR